MPVDENPFNMEMSDSQ
jgi:hypothetical protein